MVKPLHIANSIDELKKMAELGTNIKTRTALQLSKSVIKVLEVAEQQRLMGDEENAYIFYMKYFGLVTTIQKLKDFKNIKKEQRKFFGSNKDIDKRLDDLEKLDVSLKKRYAEKQQLLNAKKEQEEEIVKSQNAYATVASTRTKNFILPTQLHAQVNAKDKILLLDCRCKEDYELSKISFGNEINVPEDIITSGTTASKLGSKIAANSQNRWEKRDTMDLVVLVDEDTSESQPNYTSKPIWHLRKVLLNWDPDKVYKSILILEGGFQHFLVTYPMRTTNSKYDKKKETTKMYPSLEGIEYPSYEDIKMKVTDAEKEPHVPRIDRSSKPTIFGQKSTNNQQPLNPVALAYEKEKMYDQILAKDKEVLNIGNELTQVVNSTIIPSDADPTELYNKHSELEYKYIQKENELNDTISELQSEFETLQIDIQNPEVAAITARIDQKAREHHQYEQKRTETKQQIDQRMNVVREQQKRHLQEKDEEDDLIRPKAPAFDRSSKPTTDQFESMPQINRDFSPVHRSFGDSGNTPTGLNNMGNTCYMNSVIQCLLNLEELCEYFNSNYSRHINRKSKTRGRVTEELAQLCQVLCSGKYKSIAPRDFRNIVGQEHKIFASYDQQDSHELLVILLDMLHLELQYPMDDAIVRGELNKSEVAWRDFLKNKESRIQSMFFGQIRSLVKCKSCGFESATYEGFSHLSLELPQNNKQCNLYDCLGLYFDGETIDGWTCPKCKQNREAIKKLDISKLPPVLVIHLKRFYASFDSANTCNKLTNYVYFPTNDLNITEYIVPAMRQRKSQTSYDLYAVSNHYGTMNRGHYTAFCKNTKSKQWYKYDDNYVTQISSGDVNSSAGYILFYTSQ